MTKHIWQYPMTGPADMQWGLVCFHSGRALVDAGQDYPPKTAIEQYMFSPSKGRIISEYQLIYLTKGQGTFFCETLGRENGVRVKAGDAFMLFPGEWHTYYPDRETGWEEFWIDFVGEIPDEWVRQGLLKKSDPVFHVGINQDIIRKYSEASDILQRQKSSYQQSLCGICVNIICDVYYRDRNHQFEQTNVAGIIDYSRAMIDENFRTIRGEDLAKASGFGYTKFRQLFKQYTGITVGAYISEIRISKAKELLSSTGMSVKEIAYECGFINNDYFSAAFRKSTGETASQFRKHVLEGESSFMTNIKESK